MKVYDISLSEERKQSFKGRRTARNAAEQLTRNNKYSLSEPNQRYITNSIKELSKVPGKANVNFLLDTAEKVKYSTNIHLKNLPKHDWKGMLLTAAASAAAITPFLLKSAFNQRVENIKNSNSLSQDEQDILALRDKLKSSVNLEQISQETSGPVRDFENNLDYFIVSSETTVEHKKYVLQKLNYFMSDEYEITPQLKDKKSIAVAEMVNDMAIHTPGQKIPNIKAVNQKQHGTCAAIAIVRKKLAYEDKPNYVDMILSELDSNDYLLVYDRGKLYTGVKTKVEKIPVDFDTALANGYRIIDASTMQWMQVAQMSGSNSIAYNEYLPFDKDNFDVNTDAFYNVKFDNPDLEKAQTYYQALVKANSILTRYKASELKMKELKTDRYSNLDKSLETLAKTHSALINSVRRIDSRISIEDANKLVTGIINLNHQYSHQIRPEDKFAYIPNEESSVKKEKIKGFILENSAIKNIEPENLDTIFDLVDYYTELKSQNSVKSPSVISKARKLYDAAAAFRYQMVKGLEEPNVLNHFMLQEGLEDYESIIVDAINKTILMIENNSKYSDFLD